MGTKYWNIWTPGGSFSFRSPHKSLSHLSKNSADWAFFSVHTLNIFSKNHLSFKIAFLNASWDCTVLKTSWTFDIFKSNSCPNLNLLPQIFSWSEVFIEPLWVSISSSFSQTRITISKQWCKWTMEIGLRNGSVDKFLALQSWGPKFEP